MTRKLLSRFLRVVSLLLIIVAVAALMLSMLLKDVNYYTRMGLQNFEKATGYRLTFRDVTTHVGRGLGLRIDDFTLSQPATGREFLRGSHIYVRIKLSHLLKKKITIQQLLFEIRRYRCTAMLTEHGTHSFPPCWPRTRKNRKASSGDIMLQQRIFL